MSRWLNISRSLICALLSLAATTALSDLPDTPDDRVKFFATCTGRLSAVIEHQWHHDGPGSEQTEARRAVFVDLINALMPYVDRIDSRSILSLRVHAKLAHAQLLQQILNASDPRISARAKRVAQSYLSQCEAVLLS
ncbi:MAG: hypothetical protein AAF729_09525 [Pseudomonadota bacterium]